jgi:glycyl-tRNA synthetase
MPLFEKGGMEIIAAELHSSLCKTAGILSSYDASGSIGRRYARADEVGIPWAITIDHQSLEDKTATVRNRDTQQQIRVKIEEITNLIHSSSMIDLF